MGYYFISRPAESGTDADRLIAMEAAKRFCREFPGADDDNLFVSLCCQSRTAWVSDGTNTAVYRYDELNAKSAGTDASGKTP